MPLSTWECTACVSIGDEPLMVAAMNLATAMPRLVKRLRRARCSPCSHDAPLSLGLSVANALGDDRRTGEDAISTGCESGQNACTALMGCL